MTTVSYSTFRQNLSLFLSKAEEDREEIVVDRGKGRKAVVLSLDEYASLQETAYLLTSPANRAHLARSLQEAAAGDTVSIAI